MAPLIRLACEDDAGAIAAVYRPYVESTVISFEIEPPDEVEMRRRIRLTLDSLPWLVYEDGGDVAGYAYAAPHRARAAYDWSVDTAVYVAAAHHRRGIGHGLYRSLLGILARQGYVNAYAGVTLPNAASVGLHERVRFEPVGVYRRVGYKLGAWHDVGWWQASLGPHAPAPGPPVALPHVPRDREWDVLLARGLDVIRPTTPAGHPGGSDE